jgi:hypothetical protein
VANKALKDEPDAHKKAGRARSGFVSRTKKVHKSTKKVR